MGLRDRLRERSRRAPTTEGADAIGLGDASDHEPGEGGPSFLKSDLAAYRWATQQEAVNVGRRGVDPERWDEGRMAFEYERTIARGHEALRDRLANYVGTRLRDEVGELFDQAGEVAVAHEALRHVDAELVNVMNDWRSLKADVSDDEMDIGRFTRARSPKARAVKYAIFGAFVASEFVISGTIFEQTIRTDVVGLGFIFALGLMVLLIVIPHYAAQGLKEGVTHYHSFERDHYVKTGADVPFRLERQVHQEGREDQGFRITVAVLALVLLGLIIPLSMLRAAENEGLVWFFFFLFLQIGISGYFFLREWLDHDAASHNLTMLTEEKEALEALRMAALEDVSSAVAEFRRAAADVALTVQQAPRWDSQIVEAYYETIHYFRHLVALQQPEAEQFITWARITSLENRAVAEQSGYPLDSVEHEHAALAEDGPMGREWWMRMANEALGRDGSLRPSEGDDPEFHLSWLVTHSPLAVLDDLLERHFDIELPYKRPAGIDPSPLDADEGSLDVATNLTVVHPARPGAVVDTADRESGTPR